MKVTEGSSVLMYQDKAFQLAQWMGPIYGAGDAEPGRQLQMQLAITIRIELNRPDVMVTTCEHKNVLPNLMLSLQFHLDDSLISTETSPQNLVSACSTYPARPCTLISEYS